MHVKTNRILNDTKEKKRKIRSLFLYLDIQHCFPAVLVV